MEIQDVDACKNLGGGKSIFDVEKAAALQAKGRALSQGCVLLRVGIDYLLLAIKSGGFGNPVSWRFPNPNRGATILKENCFGNNLIQPQ
ncbi:MAG: hypothetical protein WA110_01770 [Anaerolineaceae bacterium]